VAVRAHAGASVRSFLSALEALWYRFGSVPSYRVPRLPTLYLSQKRVAALSNRASAWTLCAWALLNVGLDAKNGTRNLILISDGVWTVPVEVFD